MTNKLTFYCISDLHLEYYDSANDLYDKIRHFLPNVDILILAGDIGQPLFKNGHNYRELLKLFKKRYEHVILVPGNHEYYQISEWMCRTTIMRQKYLNQMYQLCKKDNDIKSETPDYNEKNEKNEKDEKDEEDNNSIDDDKMNSMNYVIDAAIDTIDINNSYGQKIIIAELKKICNDTKVIFLNKCSVIIGNIKFIGTTMWTKTTKEPFSRITDSRTVFKNVNEYNLEFYECLDWLTAELNNETLINEEYDIIVITHHLPSRKLCHPKFINNPCSTCYYADIFNRLNLDKVKYWFAGHTHEYSEITYNTTKIIVNPYGYPGEEKETNVSIDSFTLNY